MMIYLILISQFLLGTSNEVQIDTAYYEVIPHPAYQRFIDVAYNYVDKELLVVWADARSGNFEIYGSIYKVTETGIIREKTRGGFKISPGRGDYPSVCFDGENYLVVYIDYRFDANGDVYGIRIKRDGEIIDKNGFFINLGISGVPYRTELAFTNGYYLAVWDENADLVRGARILPDGNVLDPNGIIIGSAANGQYGQTVSGDGSRFLIVWHDYRSGTNWDIYGNFLDPVTGALSNGSSGFPIYVVSSHSQNPKVVFNPYLDNYVLTFEDRTPGFYQIYGTEISKTGTILFTPKRLTNTTTNDYIGIPVPLNNPDKSMRIFVLRGYGMDPSDGEVYFFDVDSLLNRLSNNTVLTSNTYNEGYDQYNLPLVFYSEDNLNYFVLCFNVYYSGNYQDVYLYYNFSDYDEVLTPAGWVSEPQSGVRGCRGEDRYLVVYSTRGDIWGRLYSLSGLPLGSPFAISEAANSQENPKVNYNPYSQNFIVIWDDYRNGNWDIYGARISLDGTILDPAGFTVVAFTSDQRNGELEVEPSTGRFFVCWQDMRSGNWDIYGKLFNSSGSPLTGDLIISNAANTQWFPDVVFIPSPYDFYFIVYESYQSGARYDLYYNRVSNTGTVLDGSGVPLFTLYSHKRFPHITYNGTNIILTWTDYRSGSNWDIYISRVSPAGAFLDYPGIAVSNLSTNEAISRVSTLDDHIVVIWQDNRNGRMDIYGKVIDYYLNSLPENLLLSDLKVNGFLFTPNDFPPDISNITPLTDSTFLITYERFVEFPFHNKRAHFVLFRDNSPSIKITSVSDTLLFTGSIQNISYSTRGFIERVSLYYSVDGINFSPIYKDTLNIGNFDFIVPNIPSKNFYLKIESEGVWKTFDISKRLCTANKLNVLYPNSPQDTLKIGNTYAILWEESGIGGFVNIEISYDNGSTFITLESACPDTGKYLWTAGGIETNQAILKITHLDYPQNRDYSGNFVIKGLSSNITVIKPNIRDTFYVGDTLRIKWSYLNVDKFRLYLTPDSSISYVVIAPYLENVDNYLWTVGNYETPYAKIRVENLDAPYIFDESDEYFKIKQPINILSPLENDTFISEGILSITWDILKPELVETVDIFISYDGGRTYTLIGDNIDAGLFTFNYPLPSGTYDSCRVKIAHFKRGWLIYKESGIFQIYPLEIKEKDKSFYFNFYLLGKTLYIKSPKNSKCILKIYNVAGRLIYKRDLNLKKGLNKIEIPLDLKGSYVIEINQDKESLRRKIVKFN